MARDRSERGATLVEVIVTMGILATVASSFYMVLFSVTQRSQNARSIAVNSEEGRLGFNRMVRDTREAQDLQSGSPNSYAIKVDFENDGIAPAIQTFSWNGESILLNDEVLMDGVDCIRPAAGSPCSQDPFVYTSNRLEYDWNRDGITTWQELDESAAAAHGVVGVGNDDDQLNVELRFITDITFAVQVTDGEATSRLVAQAQLRNRR